MGNSSQTNPYVGLRSFDTDESLLFFGRDNQTLELLQRLHEHSFVAVVGSSGSGKSSLLRAGLIPALTGGFLVNNSDSWKVAIMKPGQRPLYNLAEAVLREIGTGTTSAAVTDLVQKIGEFGASAIIDLIAPMREKTHFNFFLLIDQFEELFRFSMNQNQVDKKDAAIDFVNIFLELSTQKVVPFYVVLTMRSDFIGDCSQFHGLPEAMNKSQYLVPRLNRQQLKKVIEGPVKLFGGQFESALTSRLLNHVGKVTDELPVLQHALMRMWDFEMKEDKSGALDLADYEKIGGIEKALSMHADEALNELSKSEKKIARNLFKGLTAIDDYGRKIRRPALLSELCALTGVGADELLTIIDHFVRENRSFLIIQNVGDSDDRLIDISHESLIRQWGRLEKWVVQEDENAKAYLKLIDTKLEHDRGDKGLLDDLELQKFLDWRDRYKPTKSWATRYGEGFKESMTYIQKSETAQKRKRLRKKILIAGSVLAVIITLVGFMIYQSNVQKRDLAIRLHENAQKLLNTDATKSLLLEVAAFNVSGKQDFADYANAIYDGNYSIYKIKKKKSPYPMGLVKKPNDTLVAHLISPTEDKLFAEYSSGNARLIRKDGTIIHNFDSIGVGAKVFSSDGSKFALGQKNGKISVWDVKVVKGGWQKDNSQIAISSMAFSNSGTELVTGDSEGKVTLWDSQGNLKYLDTLADAVRSPVSLLRFAPDDSLFFAGSYFNSAVGSKSTLIQLSTASSGTVSYDQSGLLYAAAFDTINDDLITGGEDRKVRIWDVKGNYSDVFSGHNREVVYVNLFYVNDRRYILSASTDHMIILWDDSGMLQKFIGHEDNVTSVTFGSDRTSIISQSEDLSTREWALKGAALDNILKVVENTGKEKAKKKSGLLMELERFLEDEKTDSLYKSLKKEFGVD